MIDIVPKFIKGKRPNALPDAQVRKIKKLLKDGVPVKVIALDYNRSPQSISMINVGATYKDIV